MAAAAEEAADKIRRTRALLAGFYGAAEEDEREQELDSQDFDVKPYLSKLVENTRLVGLISKHRELSSQIKKLDSSMQQLIYENYNKFITATDEIKSMKSNMEAMDVKMNQLQDTIGTVVTQSTDIQTKLQPKREQIEEMTRVRFLLQRLQGVFELPQKLRICIDNDALEIAARHYATAIPFLDKYGDAAAFKGIKTDCESLAEEIGFRLKKRIRDHPESVGETLRLLQQLGEETGSLLEVFVQCQRLRLAQMVGAAREIASIMAKAHREGTPLTFLDPTGLAKCAAWGLLDREQGLLSGFPQLIAQIDGRVFTLLSETAGLFHEFFQGNEDSLELVAADTLQALAEVVLTAAEVAFPASPPHILTRLPPSPAPLQGTHLSGDLGDASAAVQWGAGDLSKGLVTFATDISRMEHIYPAARIPHLRDLVLVRVLRSYTLHALQLPAELCAAEIRQLADHGGSTDAAAATYRRAHIILTAGTEAALAACKRALEPRPFAAVRDYVTPAAHVGARNLFLALSAVFRSMGVDDGTTAPVRLVMARLCQEAATTLLPNVSAALQRLFAMHGEISGSNRIDGEEADDEVDPLAMRAQPFAAPDAARPLQTAVETLVQMYIESEGRSLAMAVRKSLVDVDWMAIGAPSAPRPVCKELERGVLAIQAHVGELSAGRAEAAGGAGEGAEGRAPSVKDSIYPQTGAGLHLDAQVVMTGVLRVAFKAWVETLRLLTLGPGAFQQMQVDVAFLRHLLQPHTGSTGQGRSLRFILDEVERTAELRAVSKTPLALEDLAAIVGVPAANLRQALKTNVTAGAGSTSVAAQPVSPSGPAAPVEAAKEEEEVPIPVSTSPRGVVEEHESEESLL